MTAHASLKRGDRVKLSRAGIQQGLPQQAGTVLTITKSGVTVLWDGHKTPARYHAAFIARATGAKP